MMYNMDVRRRKGFSLIELLITIAVMLVLVGVAAFFLEDYVHKSKVAKATQDLDMFRSALNIYDAIEPKVFRAYSYFNGTDVYAASFGFHWNGNVASYDAAWSASGGSTAAADWTNTELNSLGSLVGTYLKDFPLDPWGNAYKVNSSAGYVVSYGADGITSDLGANVRNKDILQYYLSKNPLLVDVVIRDNDGDNSVSIGDYLDFKFSKDIQFLEATIAITNFEVQDPADGSWAALTPADYSSAIRLADDGRTIRYSIGAIATDGLTINNSDPSASSKIRLAAAGYATATGFIDTDPYYKTNDNNGKLPLVAQNSPRTLRVQ